MEKITTRETTLKKSDLIWKIFTLALCWALTLWNVSCGKATQEDIFKQEKKIETISFKISQYKKAYIELWNKYNELFKYPKTEDNKNDINRSLAQMYEKIQEYDEELRKLDGDKIRAIDKLNKLKADAEVNYAPNDTINTHRRDHLQ